MPLQEALIVIPDLYFPKDLAGEAASATVLAGLEYLARFGDRRSLEDGWRRSLTRWAGQEALAHLEPAVLAALPAQQPRAADSDTSTQAEPTVWMATPVHLVASLTSLHLDRRSVLYLEGSELLELATDFERTFHGSGYRLEPLESGTFALLGPATAPVATCEPARAMAGSVAECLPRGPGAAALRRLGAEIEMWLHEHALNEARRRRGELAVTSLWLWGGGARGALPDRASAGPPPDAPMMFGEDAFARGLWRYMAVESRALPDQFADILRYPRTRGAVLVIEAGRMLQSNRSWTLPDALNELDRRFLQPAVQSLRRGAVREFQLWANDWRLSLRGGHRLRLWRRGRAGLAGLL